MSYQQFNMHYKESNQEPFLEYL